MEVDILIVEDNSDDLALALRVLTQQHPTNRIAVARDGAEALDFLFCTGVYAQRNIAHRPRVILLDLNLPKVKGLDVLQRLRADPRTHSIPVVVLTSSSEIEDVIASYQLGSNSYITKPVDFRQFSEVVRQVGSYWLLHNRVPATTKGQSL
jgi:CheY-like chemotaxis protein